MAQTRLYGKQLNAPKRTMDRARKRPREAEVSMSDTDEDNDNVRSGASGSGSGSAPSRGSGVPRQPPNRADDFIPTGDDEAMDVATCTYEPFPEDTWWVDEESATSDEQAHCYFCTVYSGSLEVNEWRDKMASMIKTLCVRMDMRMLCEYVARFHQAEVEPYDPDHKEMSSAMVYRHFTDHEILPHLLTADFLRTTKRYHHQYKQTAVRKDMQGRVLPPDPEHVKGHLRVMQMASTFCTKLAKQTDNN